MTTDTSTSGLPAFVSEASVRHESSYGTIELKGAFLWLVALLVLKVVL